MLFEAVPAALGAAISPTALLFIAFLLTNSRPRKRALAFLTGAAIITLGAGFVIVLVIRGTGIENTRHRTVPPWIDLGLGILLVVFAVVVYLRPPRGPKAAKERRELGLIGLIGIGMFMYSPSPFYLASLHAIVKGHSSALVSALYVILVAGIYMLLIEIPIIAHAIWPEATIRVVTAVNSWLAKHGRMIIMIAAAAFGAYLVITGLSHLV